jgi:hypothetical protein
MLVFDYGIQTVRANIWHLNIHRRKDIYLQATRNIIIFVFYRNGSSDSLSSGIRPGITEQKERDDSGTKWDYPSVLPLSRRASKRRPQAEE